MSTNNGFVVMRVWLPSTSPGVHPPLLTLESPNALLFFLEALARGNWVFPAEKEFTIVAYQGSMQIGYGVYSIHSEPVKLCVVKEQGEIEGVVQEAWGNMIAMVFAE